MSKHTNDFIITNCDTHVKEFKRMLWERIKKNTLERINLLKSSSCAEPKGRVLVSNSWKEKRKLQEEEKQVWRSSSTKEELGEFRKLTST